MCLSKIVRLKFFNKKDLKILVEFLAKTKHYEFKLENVAIQYIKR